MHIKRPNWQRPKMLEVLWQPSETVESTGTPFGCHKISNIFG